VPVPQVAQGVRDYGKIAETYFSQSGIVILIPIITGLVRTAIAKNQPQKPIPFSSRITAPVAQTIEGTLAIRRISAALIISLS
jgi:hypothetical protein